MKGVVVTEFLDVAGETFGPDGAADVAADARPPTGGGHLSRRFALRAA